MRRPPLSDPLQIVHSAEQPTLEELRQEFRAQNQARIHRMLREDTITFRNADGSLLRDAEGNVVRKKTGYLTDAPPGRDHRRLDEARAQGQAIPQFTSDFIIPASPGLDRELKDLVRDASAMREAEHVQHPAVESREGPPLAALDDAHVLDYIDNVLKETNGPENCSSEATPGSGPPSAAGTG